MSNVHKLPSGNWRATISLGKDPSGKYVRKSITARTKKEAELAALRYLSENHLDDSAMSVGDAIDKYIMDCSATLSPSTIRGYRAIQKHYISGITSYMADRIQQSDLQQWVNALSRKYSAKTIKNSYGLVHAAILSIRPDFHPQVKLPSPDAKAVLIPSDDDIRKMLDIPDHDLKICIMLGAFCGMRRGEICYLRYRDINNGCISIHGDMVLGSDKMWSEKNHAKTRKSNRTVRAPQYVLDEIGSGDPDERIIKETPDCITCRFARLMKKLDMPYHFHLLRHYFASTMIAEGVPKTYIQALGGWENGGALDSVYTHILQSAENEYSEMVSDYFSEKFS